MPQPPQLHTLPSQHQATDYNDDSRPPSFVSLRKVLKFRHKTTFSQCDVCFDLKAVVASPRKTWQERYGALKLYRTHLHHQYADRTCLWALRAAATQEPNSGLLVMMLDGMDQGKFALPRDPGLRGAASVEKYLRPRMKLHGCWVFGWTLELRVLDETARHDSACIIEIVSQALERVAVISVQTGRTMPHTLVIISDNTVREAKNQHVFKQMAHLLSKHKVRLVGVFFLRAHHTHDCIDQLWGIIARRIANSDKLRTPEDVMEVIKSELQRPSVRAWIGEGTEHHIEKLDVTRNWQQHLSALRVGLEGGLLVDHSANHFFVFMLRRDLPEALQRKVDNRRNCRAVHRSDVVALVKQYIGSPSLRQDPLLVLPYGRAEHVQLVPDSRSERRPPAHADDWRKLAHALRRHYGAEYNGTADYLDGLADNTIAHAAQLHPLPWHREPGCGDPNAMAVAPYVPHECVQAALAPSVPLRVIWRR